MLLSMTGFGEARQSTAGPSVSVEVRSVNNRYLKTTVRGTDPYPLQEPEIEKIVRRYIRRGSVLVHIRVDRPGSSSQARINTGVLKAYLEQIQSVCGETGRLDLMPSLVSNVLTLPGVAHESGLAEGIPDDEWPIVEATLEKALTQLDASRKDEGQAMAKDLLYHHQHLMDQLELVKQILPHVMVAYRARLLDRVKAAVAEAGVSLEPDHLIREVALYADRTDVAEEVVRLEAHLSTYAEIIRTGTEGAGRRLEFVVQEMGREVNTLGSKAGDVGISRHAVEMKATLEKIREMVQNVE